jgi:hypothetical protein
MNGVKKMFDMDPKYIDPNYSEANMDKTETLIVMEKRESCVVIPPTAPSNDACKPTETCVPQKRNMKKF